MITLSLQLMFGTKVIHHREINTKIYRIVKINHPISTLFLTLYFMVPIPAFTMKLVRGPIIYSEGNLQVHFQNFYFFIMISPHYGCSIFCQKASKFNFIKFFTTRVQLVSVSFLEPSKWLHKYIYLHLIVIQKELLHSSYQLIIIFLSNDPNVNIYNLFEGTRKDTLTICTLIKSPRSFCHSLAEPKSQIYFDLSDQN